MTARSRAEASSWSRFGAGSKGLHARALQVALAATAWPGWDRGVVFRIDFVIRSGRCRGVAQRHCFARVATASVTASVMLLICAAAAAEAASVATAPFDAFSGGGHRRSSARVHVGFRLPATWRRAHGIDGQPLLGDYERAVSFGHGGVCTLRLSATGEAARRRPSLTGRVVVGRDGPIHVTRTGRGTVQWVRGDGENAATNARGFRRLETRFAQPGDRWAVFDLELGRDLERYGPPVAQGGYRPLVPTRRQRRECARLQGEAARLLDAAVASSTLVPGPPPTSQ
jgi:hypothetical protein